MNDGIRVYIRTLDVKITISGLSGSDECPSAIYLDPEPKPEGVSE